MEPAPADAKDGHRHRAWLEERRQNGPPTVAAAVADATNQRRWSKLNGRIGLRITLIVGTMWCAYGFALIALLSLPQAITSHNLVIIVAWISSNFLQLVLLPIIIVGQNVQATAADARAIATYNDAAAILEDAKAIQAHLEEQDKKILAILAHLETMATPT